MCCKISKLSHKKKKMTIVYLKVGTYIQLHYLQVAVATPKGGIAILRSLLTDNLPSPGKVGHPPSPPPHQGLCPPTLFKQWCGFFYIPHEPDK